MSIPFILVKAQRVSTMLVRDDTTKAVRFFASAFLPTPTTIKDLRAATLPKAKKDDHVVHIDISDETGEYTTGASWIVTSLDIAGDNRALNFILTKV